jgi:hypothetical protein
METLVKSVAEFFAAVLGLVGFVGKARRRAGIRDDLALITELAEHPDFRRGSWPHQALMNRVALDVARLAGVPIPGRKRSWSTIFLALLIGVPLGYWTFKLNEDGFVWYSLFPGAGATFMAMAILGTLLPSPDESAPDDGEFVAHPLAGDVNAQKTVESDDGSSVPG